jgi:hypothetical protein
MTKRLRHVPWAAVALLLSDPRPGLAIPIHGDPKGFLIHQAAHLLVMGSMLFFIYTLKREGLFRQRGFRLLAWASGLFGFWSLAHFLGHFSEVYLAHPVIVGRGLSQQLLMEDSNTWVYYFTRLDNLILAASFYFLFSSLKVLAREPPGEPR